MGCTKSLDFATTGGAHLSFYWTMDEAGVADKVDSTAGIHWPIINGASAAVGLFSNGTDCDNTVILGFHRGVGMYSDTNVTIDQSTSTGISVWFWVKLVAYGSTSVSGTFYMDTSDVMHTNRFRTQFGFTDALNGSVTVEHTNDTDDAFVDSSNLTWSLGSWHMIAITYDKTAQTINSYADGVLVGTIADPFMYPDLTSTNMELANVVSPGNGSDFIVDEFGLSTKGALSAAQVTSLYNLGAGLTWPNITPIVPYP